MRGAYHFVSVLTEPVHLINAVLADELAVELNNLVGTSAENTCRCVLFENNFVFVNKYFNRILGFDVHFVAKFNRENDSSELVDPTNYASRFHFCKYFLSL